ncbi:uncharacterized protein LOC124444440 [Xenia sp. Carnegie-2017]|uniref:uncharacterized protein LOC124444440 n=1 Tax=Xenia sp. Carnegie-2017 TaxID=2897299 RepID=UPI001F0492EE|nr:uncharacterized protein LOC124444440 [Xenia sp. Carnegie-2017]
MVRVLICHNFQERKVFSDAYEAIAIAYSISRDAVFISTKQGHVFVYSLSEDGFPLLCQFPTVSVATEIIFGNVGCFLFTKEMIRKDKRNSFTARVYFNWSKWVEHVAKIQPVQIGFSLTENYSVDESVPVALEVPSKSSVCAICCCPVSSNIAVAAESTITVYEQCKQCSYDFQRLYTIEASFSMNQLAICKQYVAFTSTCEVRVLQVKLDNEEILINMEKNLANHRTAKELVTQQTLSASACQKEVLDESYVLWKFDQYEKNQTDKFAFWESILGSKEWVEDVKDENFSSDVIDLPSLKDEVPFIDYSQTACEVLGPVNTVHGHPVRVQTTLKKVKSVTMLYCYFDWIKEDHVIETELHSLQLQPTFTAFNHNKMKTPELSGMMCFISSPKQGFLYNVFGESELIARCMYTADVTSAVICNNMLYSITKHLIETYTIPLYATIAKYIKSRSLMAKMMDLLYRILCVLHCLNCNCDIATYFMNHLFYILFQPCPSPSTDLYMIGVDQIPGLCSILAAGKRILTLSYAPSSPSMKKWKKSKGHNGDCVEDWTLHVLTSMELNDLYERMESLTEKSDTLTADLRLLKEQHFILRTQFQVGKMTKSQQQTLLLALRNSYRNLGHYFSRYSMENENDVNEYYKMANLSLEDVVNENVVGDIGKLKEMKFGKGLLHYLNTIFFSKNQEKTCIDLSKVAADKVMHIYYHSEPAQLANLILRSLLHGYNQDFAIKLFKQLKSSKGYSFSREDHLALCILYLQSCMLDEAIDEIVHISKEKLADICVKYHYVLHTKEEYLNPLGQLLRKYLPEVLAKTLVFLHLRHLLTLTKTIDLLQGKDRETQFNNHLQGFLEILLNDSKGARSFNEARKLLVDIYLKKLVHRPCSREKQQFQFPHYHIPRGTGHFARRFSWLDKLPPFNGHVTEPCPISRANIVAASSPNKGMRLRGLSREKNNKIITEGNGESSFCSCRYCWQTLLKLQSLLSSRYCDEQLGRMVLKNLVGKSWEISITLLCLPLIAEYEKAVETILLIDSSILMTYVNHYFGDSCTKWRCLLHVLTEKNRTDSTKYCDIIKETLVILSKFTSPTVFLSLLPEDVMRKI